MVWAGTAGALTFYTDVIGTDVSFTSIQEASSFGDPEPLFGQPLGSGNQLLFFPLTFSASAAGGGFDQTGSQLQLMITANGPLDVIDTVKITEFGDATLSGVGTAATGTFASMSGFLQVTEVLGLPIAPVVIGFLGTFTPSDLLALPGDAGTTIWTGSTSIDVAAIVPNATKATLSFDNDLSAFTEVGTTATIQKKVVSGPAIIIEVIPEPATGGLLLGGLLALAASRGRRAKH